MVTIQDGDMDLLFQIKEIDDKLAEIPDFSAGFLSEIDDYNAHVDEINENIQTLQKQIAEINEKAQELKQNIEKHMEEIKLLQSKLKEKENVNNMETISDSIAVQNYQVMLAEKMLDKKNSAIVQKKTEIENLNIQKKSIEQSFAQIKEIIESDKTDKNDIEDLTKKRAELVDKLSFYVKDLYNKLTIKDQKGSLAILRNGICSNCNLFNITKQQLDILLKKQIVKCEYCSSILVGVENDNATSRGNRKNPEQKDDNDDDNDDTDHDSDIDTDIELDYEIE